MNPYFQPAWCRAGPVIQDPSCASEDTGVYPALYDGMTSDRHPVWQRMGDLLFCQPPPICPRIICTVSFTKESACSCVRYRYSL